jgi:hypothetical protein
LEIAEEESSLSLLRNLAQDPLQLFQQLQADGIAELHPRPYLVVIDPVIHEGHAAEVGD